MKLERKGERGAGALRTLFILLVFSAGAAFVARNIVRLQLMPLRTRGFLAIAFFSIIVTLRPQLSLLMVAGSVSLYDPRYWFTFIRIYLHQWLILFSIILAGGQYIYRRRKFTLHRLDILLAALFATYLLSLVNSPNIGLSIKWSMYFLTLVAGFLHFRLVVSEERQLGWTWGILILGGALNGVYSCFHPAVGTRVGGIVLKNPNALGNFLTMILPLALALLLFGSLPKRFRILIFFGAAALVISIVLTGSRSSWVGAVAGTVTLFFFKPRLKYILPFLLILAAVASLPGVQHRLIEEREDPGVTYRKLKIAMGYQLFKESPVFGHGPGSFQAYAPEEKERGIVAHSALENLYLQILCEGGLVQSLVFLALVAYVTYLGLSTVTALPDGFLQALALGNLAGFWAVLGIGIGENAFLYPMINWLVGWHLASIVIIRELAGITPPGEKKAVTIDEDRPAKSLRLRGAKMRNDESIIKSQ